MNSQFCTDERFCFLDSGELSNFFNDASCQGVFFVGLNTGDKVVLTEQHPMVGDQIHLV